MAQSEYALSRIRVEGLMLLRGFPEWQDLAEAIGSEPRKIWRWTSGMNEIKASDLALLADALKTSMDYLVGRTDDSGITLDENTFSERELKLIAVIRAGYLDEALDLLLKLKRASGSAG